MNYQDGWRIVVEFPWTLSFLLVALGFKYVCQGIEAFKRAKAYSDTFVCDC